MQSILDAINEWIKEILIGAINGNLSTMFGDVNEKVGTIANEVGQTPQGWNANIFSMIQTLFRKWGGIPTAITQNVKDLLASREVENIFENSDFVLMLNQAQGDRTILAKQLNISPQQMKYVTHTEAGEGLIFYGNVVLPFVDRFPKDTELYRVMTTKPEEVSSL